MNGKTIEKVGENAYAVYDLRTFTQTILAYDERLAMQGICCEQNDTPPAEDNP